MSIDVKVIGGGALPPELAGLLGGGTSKSNFNPRPARLEHLQGLLEAMNQPGFQIGDIVQLRDFAANNFKWPTAEDRCIVTQVLDTPYRSGDCGTAEPAMRKNFAIAFVSDDGEIHEYLHDSRHFVKVGSIYDPVTLPDGEVLPVE